MNAQRVRCSLLGNKISATTERTSDEVVVERVKKALTAMCDYSDKYRKRV